jgi:hypothetical protein
VRRRARQNKTPNNEDMDQQDSRIHSLAPDSLTFNILNGQYPRFGAVNKFDGQVYNAVTMVDAGTIYNTSTSGFSNAGLYFTAAAHIGQFSSFAAVFDQYRIKTIEVWLTTQNYPSVSNYSNIQYGKFLSVIDYDNASGAFVATDLLAYQNVLVTNGADGHYRKWVPHIAQAAYTSAVAFSGFSNVTSPWIDCASSTVEHFGIKAGSDTVLVAGVVNMLVRVHTQYRNIS